MGFSPSSAQGKGGAGFQMFDSCWPKGAAELPRPSATRSLPEAPTVPGASGPAERASPAQPAPSLRTRPERRAPAQAHFRKKSLSSRRPQPDPHPATFHSQGPGARAADRTLVPAREGHARSRPEPRRGQGSDADRSPGAAAHPRPPTPPTRPPPGAPHAAARPGTPEGEQLPGGATSPRRARALTHRGLLPSARGPVGSCAGSAAAGAGGGGRAGGRTGDACGSTRRARSERRGASARGLHERAGERARSWSSSRRRSEVAPTGAQRAAVARGRRPGTPGGRPRNGSSVKSGRLEAHLASRRAP
ncbi:translation initiation factor IF-2-like [Mustela putorius furo]|uniref:Translation initiation factor IF-2-like n=1 Tax=Mustela putorius furo TaxID=9669 RepID=A0A8U0S5Y7_MUSPF|nr:translation initiation factor IF-2-like [Mustela putorius furo]